ncbi:MAG: ATP-dependent zinc metalloprotease FtsH [Patescibacteria group bacterium]|nr:ATP-dependent zinc metalloprotease FtsH [Patescibacteria group bacterium]
MKNKNRNWVYVAGFILLMVLFYFSFSDFGTTENEVPISQVAEEVKNERVESITVEGTNVTVNLKDGSTQNSQIAAGQQITTTLKDLGADPANIKLDIKEGEDSSLFWGVILNFAPVILIIAFFWFMLRQAQGSANQANMFGKSKAKLFDPTKQKITFKDVAGSEEEKHELTEIVEFLKYPKKFTALGAKIPKGVLLFGPPGVGKTLMARAVAGEAGVPFFSISGSEFVEMFVGVGASRVRDMFARAKKNAPCIVFIDEIDAVGRQRGSGLGGSHDEREQTLNQILTEMDGFEQGTNVIVMAATNRPDVLDPALLRPGRFDRRITLDLPDIKDREAILEVHSKGKPLEKNLDLSVVAKKTPGFSGADLYNLMNEAAILAAREGKNKIGDKHINEATEKILLGPEKKSRVLSEKEKKITAYHEAGHAIMGHLLPNTDPIHKISIISRGRSLGVTWSLPEEDRKLNSRSEMEDEIAMMLGGRTAEELIFHEVTTGASNDLERATKVAKDMVTRFGMSERLGPQVYGRRDELVFLGKELGEHEKNYSEEVAAIIDEEVKKIIDIAHKKARDILTKNKGKLDKVAGELLTKETIEGADFEKLMARVAPKKKA